jgi:hypothetical protein
MNKRLQSNGLQLFFNADPTDVRKAEEYGGVAREDLKDNDFVFADTRTFPIKTSQDVKDAISSWGRYKGDRTFEDFKRRLKAIARKKGFESALPAGWKENENA